ncbi:spore germination protein [Jeotgalibacillus sp. ET6]|uniref:spore germination protein n=1 Tax=Jeotgalibacillus sp. ET6 TaxID=3037260 RepID=UPI0024184B99|nr:spore germination protein [Jeotgalibacillus sp. ET6]MDG5471973.1 spore germination protein [Jeotgalibacillus sp. ET6]
MGLIKMLGKVLEKKVSGQKGKTQPQKQSAKSRSVSLEAIKQMLKDVQDVQYKPIRTSEGLVTLIYYQSFVGTTVLHEMVVNPILRHQETVIHAADKLENDDLSHVLNLITTGYTVIYLHKPNQFYALETFSAESRAIQQTQTESTVIGPQDSFTESFETNLSLIKRRITNADLKNKDYIIGTETNTKVAVLYIEHLVNKEDLDCISQKINGTDYDGFLDISVLKQLIEDHPLSPFPQYNMTVRPDMAMQYLLDGRIVVLMDNSQSVIICPTSFFELFVPMEDYYNRWMTATLLRSLRFFGFFVTIILTPTYISALTYHPELLPFELLLNLQESRDRVPFPPVIEVLFIELVIEILREAGSRMPTKIGQTIGIVGGIVIGTAAVEAGLISNMLVVLVAISALLSFLPSNFLMSNTSRFIRYVFILSAGMFGLYGQMIALAWLFIHLLNLTSLGKPYLAPGIPRKWTDLLDSVLRLPVGLLRFKKGISVVKRNRVSPLDEE